LPHLIVKEREEMKDKITVSGVATGCGWVVVTGIWFSLGGFAVNGFPGIMVYLGTCGLGGLLCGRFL
jgi:hypothetical protein